MNREKTEEVLRNCLLENGIALPAELDLSTSEVTLEEIGVDSITMVYIMLAFEDRLMIDEIDMPISETSKVKDIYLGVCKAVLHHAA